MAEQIRSERLVLMSLTDGQMKALMERETEPEMRKAYLEMMEGALAHPDQRDWYVAWSIALLDGQPVGDCCFKGPPRDGEVDLGYGILPEARGQGYATEAAKAICAWALRQPCVIRVTAETEPDNRASQRVLAKVGMKPFGIGAEGPRFSIDDSLNAHADGNMKAE